MGKAKQGQAERGVGPERGPFGCCPVHLRASINRLLPGCQSWIRRKSPTFVCKAGHFARQKSPSLLVLAALARGQ